METSEYRERIMFALNELLRENEERLKPHCSRSAYFAITCRRRALEDAITIVRNQSWK